MVERERRFSPLLHTDTQLTQYGYFRGLYFLPICKGQNTQRRISVCSKLAIT